jgi:hypothetical protein
LGLLGVFSLLEEHIGSKTLGGNGVMLFLDGDVKYLLASLHAYFARRIM